jgi:hypothetical protein
MKAHCDYNVVDAIGLITNVRWISSWIGAWRVVV